MQPIHELLNRIRWDDDFAEGEFVLGVYDRMEESVLLLPLHELTFVPGDHTFFHYLDAEGGSHSVPFHRIKAVYKDGVLIWHREH